MNPDEIQIATDPSQVADLIKAGPKTTVHQSANPTSGASVDEILAQIQKDAMSKEDQAKALDQLREKSKPKVKPLQLKYTYEGNHSCGNTVKTIMISTNGILTANAYCISCDETISQIEVQPIIQPKIEPIPEPEKPVEVVKAAPEIKHDIIPKKEKK